MEHIGINLLNRNQFNRIKRIAKETYYKQLLEQYRNNIKKTWGVINTLIGKTNDKTGITDSFNINGQRETCLNAISNGFCNYFTNAGRKISQIAKNITMNTWNHTQITTLFI